MPNDRTYLGLSSEEPIRFTFIPSPYFLPYKPLIYIYIHKVASYNNKIRIPYIQLIGNYHANKSSSIITRPFHVKSFPGRVTGGSAAFNVDGETQAPGSLSGLQPMPSTKV